MGASQDYDNTFQRSFQDRIRKKNKGPMCFIRKHITSPSRFSATRQSRSAIGSSIGFRTLTFACGKRAVRTASAFSIVISHALLSTLFNKYLFEGIEVLHLGGSEKQLFKLFHIVNTL